MPARDFEWTLPSAPDAFGWNPSARNIRGSLGKRLACNFQFSQSAVVIEVSIIKMIRSREVCFAGIWTNAKCFLNGCFC